MAAPASHIQTKPNPHKLDSGLEIIKGFDAQLAEQGMVPVESIGLTGSGSAVYKINRALTDEPLDEALAKRLIDPHEATELVLDALKVVSEMYRMGLDAHGGIRPGNIFVDTRHHTAAIGGFHTTEIGEKALSSFGLDVSHINGGDLEDHVDLSFTAPELVLGAEPDQRSDVYEGARTIWFALRGSTPPPTVKYFDDFVGNGLEPVPAPDLSTGFPGDTSNGVRFAIQQALDPEPDNRQQSMERLIEEISTGVYPLPRE